VQSLLCGTDALVVRDVKVKRKEITVHAYLGFDLHCRTEMSLDLVGSGRWPTDYLKIEPSKAGTWIRCSMTQSAMEKRGEASDWRRPVNPRET